MLCQSFNLFIRFSISKLMKGQGFTVLSSVCIRSAIFGMSYLNYLIIRVLFKRSLIAIMCVFRQMTYEVNSNGSSSEYDEIVVIYCTCIRNIKIFY